MTAVLAVLSLFIDPFYPGKAEAQDQIVPFISTEHGFTLGYSSEFAPEDGGVPQSVLALRDLREGFPTFNILVSAEHYDPADFTDNSYRDKIVSDYKAVGITDARSVRTYSSPVAGREVHTTEIRYQYKDKTLIASVTLVPQSAGKHFILTYIDAADQFYRRKLMREQIVNSFQFTGPSGGSAGESSLRTREESYYWVTVTVLLVFGLGLAWMLFSRFARSGKP